MQIYIKGAGVKMSRYAPNQVCEVNIIMWNYVTVFYKIILVFHGFICLHIITKSDLELYTRGKI